MNDDRTYKAMFTTLNATVCLCVKFRQRSKSIAGQPCVVDGSDCYSLETVLLCRILMSSEARTHYQSPTPTIAQVGNGMHCHIST